MPDLRTGPAALQLRSDLLGAADIADAARVSSKLCNLNVEALNDAPINTATHILSVALLARANIETAALWWADLAGVPAPEAFNALYDIAINLPAELNPQMTDIRTGKEI